MLCWTVYLGIIFVNKQLDEQFFFMYVYFYYVNVSDSYVPIIRRTELYQNDMWFMSLSKQVSSLKLKKFMP